LFGVAKAFLVLLGQHIWGAMGRAEAVEVTGLMYLGLDKDTQSFWYAINAVRWLFPASGRSSDIRRGQGVRHMVMLLIECRWGWHERSVWWFSRGQQHLIHTATGKALTAGQ